MISLAAGGTSGWFPDGLGGKPWFDASSSAYSLLVVVDVLYYLRNNPSLAAAMREFARAQDTWSTTWPSNPDDRALRL